MINLLLLLKLSLLILRLLPNHGGCHRAGLLSGSVTDHGTSSELRVFTQPAAEQAGPRGVGGGLLCFNVPPAAGERMTFRLLLIGALLFVLYILFLYLTCYLLLVLEMKYLIVYHMILPNAVPKIYIP